MLFSKWKYPRLDLRESKLIQKEYEISPMVADILTARGLNPAELADLLNADFISEDSMRMPDMEQAVLRIEQAIEQSERIAIYGDYDCDGVTATALLTTYLQSMGADVIYYIPERLDEGYGMNTDALDAIRAQGATLVVTVDNGISAIQEVAYAASIGLDVVITDHHQAGSKIPAAVAVVNPHRKEYTGTDQNLCGAGVALKLVSALEHGDDAQALETFGVLAAIATIGDIVPMTPENRSLVKLGLEQLPNTDNLGLQALMEVAGLQGKPLTAQKIAFGIVPRINAAGRMGSAKLAVELLLSEDEERALQLAQKIDELNQKRREEEEAILCRIQEKIQENPSMLFDRVMVVASENMNHGVVGIVSSRLLTLYGKPNIILSVDGDYATGSARSIGYFSLFQALTACAEYLPKYGGHRLAAGMTVKTVDIPNFSKAINQYAATEYDKMPIAEQQIDKELHIADICVEDIAALSCLEPFGEGNQPPIFLLRNCLIEELIPLSENKHLKIKVNFEGKNIFVLYFRMSTDQFIYRVGSQVDILANLELNSFRDTVSVAIRLKDIRPAGFNDEKIGNADYYYQKIRRGESVEAKIMQISVPTVDELRATYKILRSVSGRKMHVDLLYLGAFLGKINYCKYRLMLDILAELDLISIAPDFSRIEMKTGTSQVNLETSQILKGLRKYGSSN